MLKAILEELGSYREPLGVEATAELLRSLEGRLDAFADFEYFNDVTYARNRILRTESLDLLMLCWRPGQRSPIHDHAGSTCGVLVVRGEGTEVAFKRSGVGLLLPDDVTSLATGDLSVNVDSDIHVMGNFASPTEDLVTLHCYSPPLDHMNLYDQSETFLACYDEVTANAKRSGCREWVPSVTL